MPSRRDRVSPTFQADEIDRMIEEAAETGAPQFDLKPVYYRREMAKLLRTSAQTLWRYDRDARAAGKHLWVARRNRPLGPAKAAAYHPYQARLIYAVVWGWLSVEKAEVLWTGKLAELSPEEVVTESSS